MVAQAAIRRQLAVTGRVRRRAVRSPIIETAASASASKRPDEAAITADLGLAGGGADHQGSGKQANGG